jgi:hypothetical protein
MAREKTCSQCSDVFQCNTGEKSAGCWCNSYPPLFAPDPVINCMCPSCLHKASVAKINAYVAGLTVENAITDNKAKDLPPAKRLIEGIDYYMEQTNYVFTAWHHLRRGYCCKNSCRHCPYGFKKETA